MSDDAERDRLASSTGARMATRCAFLAAGLGCAVLAPLMPFIKAHLDLDEAKLGLMLLGIGTGSLIAMPLAGLLTGRYGCRTVILVSGSLTCTVLTILAIVPSVIVLIPAFVLFGATLGMLDVAMNIQAVIVERTAGRPVMSGFHALFSAGGILGAGGMSAGLKLGLSPLAATLGVVLLMAALLAISSRHLLPYGEKGGAPSFALPRGPILLIGGLCFICYMAEGSILDWSAVFLSSERGVPLAEAGIGYAAFSATMTVGRFAGDRIAGRFTGRRIIEVGGLSAATGFLLAALSPHWLVAVVGFALVGIGASNVVPVLFSAAGRHPGVPASLAVPAVTTIGYFGLLTGPVVIGFIAKGFGLAAALTLLAGLLLFMAASAHHIDGQR